MEVSEHPWVFVTLDLNLELRDTVYAGNIISAGNGTVIVVSINLLHSVFEMLQVLAWLLAQLLRELVVEVLQVVQRDAHHEHVFLRVALQLLSAKGLDGEF